jgi:hypothetical protein
MSRLARISLAALLSLVLPAALPAAPAARTAPAEAAVLNPLGILKRADLDFGTLVVAGAGTAVIDPLTGALTPTGSIVPAGAAAHPARFTGTGSKNSVVHIRIPTTPITVTRAGGTETMTVSNWTLDGATNRKVPPGSTFDFAVGATLGVGAAQADGTYTGTFNITVQYP